VSAGRVTDNDNAAQVERILPRQSAEVIDGAPDVEVRPRPPAPRLTEPAVFDVPRRDAAVLQDVTHRSEVPGRRIRCLEAAAVNEDDYGMRPASGWQAQLPELARVLSI
jgi:hypothetical protein